MVVRFVVWCFQELMWITYSGLELIFYMPMPFLLVYLVVLTTIYLQMPEVVQVLVNSLWWLVGRFVKTLAHAVLNIFWMA